MDGETRNAKRKAERDGRGWRPVLKNSRRDEQDNGVIEKPCIGEDEPNGAHGAGRRR